VSLVHSHCSTPRKMPEKRPVRRAVPDVLAMLPAHVLPSYRFPARLAQLGAEHSSTHVFDRTLHAYKQEVQAALSQFRGVILQRSDGGVMSNVEVLILPVVEACYHGMIDEENFSFERLYRITVAFLHDPRLGLEISDSRFSTKGVLTFVARQKVESNGRASGFQTVRIRILKGRRRAKRTQGKTH